MHDTISVPEADGLIHPGERLDDLQFVGLKILQKVQGFCFGMDAVLLADFAKADRRACVADFGTGTGILPLLLYGRGKGSSFHALELQEEMADMARRSMMLNGLQQTVTVYHTAVQKADKLLSRGSFDLIVCNPPYGIPGTTLINPSDTLRLARHQDEGGLHSWYKMAHLLLKGKGRFCMIYLAPRMLEAMDALQDVRLTPKRFRLIYPRADKPANLVLIEAVKDAKPMLHPEPPLIVYQENGSMTDELNRIYHIQEKDAPWGEHS